MTKNKLIIPPKPEVCDSCMQEKPLSFYKETGEWLCDMCKELIKEDRRLLDYENGKKMCDDSYDEY